MARLRNSENQRAAQLRDRKRKLDLLNIETGSSIRFQRKGGSKMYEDTVELITEDFQVLLRNTQETVLPGQIVAVQ